MCLAQGHNAVTLMRLEKTSSGPAKLGHKQHISQRACNRFNQVVEAKRFEGVFLCKKVC